MYFCPNCGNRITDLNTKFCGKCGHKIDSVKLLEGLAKDAGIDINSLKSDSSESKTNNAGGSTEDIPNQVNKNTSGYTENNTADKQSTAEKQNTAVPENQNDYQNRNLNNNQNRNSNNYQNSNQNNYQNNNQNKPHKDGGKGIIIILVIIIIALVAAAAFLVLRNNGMLSSLGIGSDTATEEAAGDSDHPEDENSASDETDEDAGDGSDNTDENDGNGTSDESDQDSEDKSDADNSSDSSDSESDLDYWSAGDSDSDSKNSNKDKNNDDQDDEDEDYDSVDGEETEPSPKSGHDTIDGQIFPDSADRKLKKREINDLSLEEVQDALNEMYARHGFEFSDETLKEYYEENMSEYDPDTNDQATVAGRFNSTEKYNKKKLEKRREKLS